MKKNKFFISLLLGVIMAVSVSVEANAANNYKHVYLSGSGPVYSNWLNPKDHFKLYIYNSNNLNVGYDVFDSKGRIVANGTIKDAGTITRSVTDNGLKYRVRLRCQEPWWNKTKCNAFAYIRDYY
ncbi:hypothetical protein ACFSCZ_11640 [Siminovitchia sediminis]|uniref:Uncharacterized protein n=1 Tax=Siminovitchia sediminis TaxID=1274353 RepID=A0ABW4KKS4_9BACI